MSFIQSDEEIKAHRPGIKVNGKKESTCLFIDMSASILKTTEKFSIYKDLEIESKRM